MGTKATAKRLLGRCGVFDGLLLGWEIQSLQRYKADHWKSFRDECANISAADSQYRHDQESMLYSQYAVESDQYDDEMQQITSNYFLKQAERLLLPSPPYSREGPDWIQSNVTGRYRLSPEAIHALRSSVRAEQRERREIVFMWLAAATGIVGALIGLVSVLGS